MSLRHTYVFVKKTNKRQKKQFMRRRNRCADTHLHTQRLRIAEVVCRADVFALITARHPLLLQTLHAGLVTCSGHADQITGSFKAEIIFVKDWCVNVHLLKSPVLFFCCCLFLISLVYGLCVLLLPDPNWFCFVFLVIKLFIFFRNILVKSIYICNQKYSTPKRNCTDVWLKDNIIMNKYLLEHF